MIAKMTNHKHSTIKITGCKLSIKNQIHLLTHTRGDFVGDVPKE